MVFNHGSGLKLHIDVVGRELVFMSPLGIVAASFSRQPQVSHKSAFPSSRTLSPAGVLTALHTAFNSIQANIFVCSAIRIHYEQ